MFVIVRAATYNLSGKRSKPPCPLSFQHVWFVRSSRCRYTVGRSQRYLGSRPDLRSPAMAVSRGPGIRTFRSVIKRRGEEVVSRDWLSPVSVLACVRSGSAVFLVGQTCAKFGSITSQVRVKFALKCAGQVHVKCGSSSRQTVGQVRCLGWVKSPGHGKASFTRGCRGQGQSGAPAVDSRPMSKANHGSTHSSVIDAASSGG